MVAVFCNSFISVEPVRRNGCDELFCLSGWDNYRITIGYCCGLYDAVLAIALWYGVHVRNGNLPFYFRISAVTLYILPAHGGDVIAVTDTSSDISIFRGGILHDRRRYKDLRLLSHNHYDRVSSTTNFGYSNRGFTSHNGSQTRQNGMDVVQGKQ